MSGRKGRIRIGWGLIAGNRFLFVPDLGSDRIVIYEMNLDDGTLKPHGHGDVPPGSGPRHLAFHPNGRFAYVANELEQYGDGV